MDAGARRTFTLMVAHEVRGPLTAALGMSELLGLPGATLSDDQASGLRDDLHEALERLAEVIDDVVVVGAGPGRLRREPVVLADAVRSGLAGDRTAGRHATTLRAAPPVCGDAAAVARCLAEMVRNGRAPSAGRSEPRLSWGASDGVVVIEAVDSGPVILPEERAAALRRLDRSPGPLRSGRNPSLGLHVAASLAEAMGGGLAFDATPQGECVLRLNLPRA